MLIDEIEVLGASLSFRCLSLKIEDLGKTFATIAEHGDAFDITAGKPGFHDFDYDEDKGLIRGYYSNLVNFPVEHLVDGLTVKTEFVRIETCEYMITPERIYLFGKPGPQKLLEMALSAVTGEHVERVEFDNPILEQFLQRLTTIKAIVVENPKDKPIRRARLSGHMEEYETYNVCDPNNHEIKSVAGIAETPLSAMKITVDSKGKVTLGVKKGLIINLENLSWIMELITSDQMPQIKEIFVANENAPF